MTRTTRHWTCIAALGALSLLAGCATPTRPDPLEPVNRALYAVHEPIDKNVVEPFIKAYQQYTWKPVRLAISNFYNNIDDLFSGINGLLQGKWEKAGNDFGRVVVNSGLGLFGLIDIASDAGIERGNEDFGQTYGYWGFPQGAYMFIPLFGPTTVRDGAGWVTRYFLGPIGYIPDVPARNVLYGIGAVDLRSQAQEAVGFVDQAALDRYAFIRRAYLQRRQYLVYDGKPPPEKEED
jgi:phospholipid-binding lipoprotein MlaA